MHLYIINWSDINTDIDMFKYEASYHEEENAFKVKRNRDANKFNIIPQRVNVSAVSADRVCQNL